MSGKRIGEHEVDLPSNTLLMNICEYKGGSKSEHHRHAYEAIIYIIEGEGYTMVSGQKLNGSILHGMAPTLCYNHC